MGSCEDTLACVKGGVGGPSWVLIFLLHVLCIFFMYLCVVYQLLFLSLQQKCLAKAA